MLLKRYHNKNFLRYCKIALQVSTNLVLTSCEMTSKEFVYAFKLIQMFSCVSVIETIFVYFGLVHIEFMW